MSKTERRGTVTTPGMFFTDRLFTYNKYWMRHDPTWYRRHLNRAFRRKEKQHFMKFGETLRKTKNRGYWW